jgi:hypothetical protein
VTKKQQREFQAMFKILSKNIQIVTEFDGKLCKSKPIFWNTFSRELEKFIYCIRGRNIKNNERRVFFYSELGFGIN